MALTSGEFDLLCAFAQHPGRVLSRDFLLEATRGREAAPFDRTIDVQVGRLRKKLEARRGGAADHQVGARRRLHPGAGGRGGMSRRRARARGRLASEEALLRSLFFAYPDALLLVDAAGRIVRANPAAARAAGL